jgi:hypothetical protein
VITGSVLLIIVAVALFAAGLYRESGSYYYSSIVISVLAAFALVVDQRQVRGRLALGDDFDLGQDWGARPVGSARPVLVELADEPPAQAVNAADAVALARLSDPVAVVDGRPRYHLPGCLHLLGRQVERLPVRAALMAEFTSCAHCQPASHLLAERRVP